MRALGLEPRTYGLKGREPRTEATEPQEFADDGSDACTSACTKPPDEAQADSPEAPDVGPTGDDFAEAMVMLARLPLTDAERAEAVRRLLAVTDQGAG